MMLMCTRVPLTLSLVLGVAFVPASIAHAAETYEITGESTTLEDLNPGDDVDFPAVFAGTFTVRVSVGDADELVFISNSQNGGGSFTRYAGVMLEELTLLTPTGPFELVSAKEPSIEGDMTLWDRADFLDGQEVVELIFDVGSSTVALTLSARVDRGDLAIGEMFNINTPAPNTVDDDFVPTFASPEQADALYTNAQIFIQARPNEFGGAGIYNGAFTRFVLEGANPADLNGDGIVNGADLTVLLGNWGGAGVGDVDGNGVVSGSDLTVLLGAWG